MKNRTQPIPATDPISMTISKYHKAPLGARRIYEAVPLTIYDRADLAADPAYFFHPSAREDLQSPLLLHPLTPSHSPVTIEN